MKSSREESRAISCDESVATQLDRISIIRICDSEVYTQQTANKPY